jgi:hypothetical protein
MVPAADHLPPLCCMQRVDNQPWSTRPEDSQACEDPAMTSIVIIVVVIVVVLGVFRLLRSHGQGLAARRGLSADLAAMADRPQVRVREVSSVAPGRVRVVLVPDGVEGIDDVGDAAVMDLIVSLEEDTFALRVLREWQEAQVSLAVVEPPGGRLVRLRSTVDLQHLTLRRADPAG